MYRRPTISKCYIYHTTNQSEYYLINYIFQKVNVQTHILIDFILIQISKMTEIFQKQTKTKSKNNNKLKKRYYFINKNTLRFIMK